MLVIFVKQWSVEDWSALRCALIYKLRAVDEGRVDIEFAPCKMKLLGLGKFSSNQFKDTRQMGDSIGVRYDGSTGTLGGFTTLTRNGQIHRSFLTHCHVVRP
ncbi:hypothetical protein N7495_010035 [Penicillium taxi]|uniref:uncharacterized protein n=1 Tax=Penicillium taxi TaxID=168475 RepID=UPI0025454946|nr:uncharacterized protein N7495_010035 [Penicillium taxi]KAJ5885525.1 hypothetical protein N7495_010035 [Penicillium taxi]